jgi:hypothetical protein
MDWWLERTPDLTFCNLINPFKFVPYGFRGWVAICVAAKEGKLRAMMPLERYLLGLTVLLFVAYIATATSSALEHRFALKFIANSLFMWNFVFLIPLGVIEQSEPRFLAVNLPVTLVAILWTSFLPLEYANPLSVDAVVYYVLAAIFAWIGGWMVAFITAHVCALRVRLSKKLSAYARQLLPKLLLLLGYLLLSAIKCWLGDESKRDGLAYAQTAVLWYAVLGGLTVGTLLERELGWAHALSLDLTPLEFCVPLLYTAWTGLIMQLYEAPEDLPTLIGLGLLSHTHALHVVHFALFSLFCFLNSTSKFVGEQRKQWVRVRVVEGEEHTHTKGLMALKDATACMDPDTPATVQYTVHYGSIFNWMGGKAKRGVHEQVQSINRS